MNIYLKITAYACCIFLHGSCGFPEDRKDNPNNEPVVHTGNATDTFLVDSADSTVMTKADTARMVFNDDSSTSGTPSGRGTEKSGNAVGTGTSRVGEKHLKPVPSADTIRRK